MSELSAAIAGMITIVVFIIGLCLLGPEKQAGARSVDVPTIADHIEVVTVPGGTCLAVYREVLRNGTAMAVSMVPVTCPLAEKELIKVEDR